MEPSLPASEQGKIDQDSTTAIASLMTYLTSKYGENSDRIDITSNDAETNMFTCEDSEVKQNETVNYTGYFLAKVMIVGQEVDVRYSPTGSTALYSLGGADNWQTQDLQNDIKVALTEILPSAAEITVRAGSLLPIHDWLLDEYYNSEDWFSPIPPDGFCYVQILISGDFAELSAAKNTLSSFFNSIDTKGVYICADIRSAASSSASSAFSPRGLSASEGSQSAARLMWENSTWNPAAFEQRLNGS